MKKSNYLWAIDAGHGGMKDGKYVTAPSKMYTYEDGMVIYEGVVNRSIATILYNKLIDHHIDFALLYDEIADTTLDNRCLRVNKMHHKNKLSKKYLDVITLSIHSNAGHGKGFEVWTSPGPTKSDVVAEYFCRKYIEHFPQYPFRSDVVDFDLDKEAKFKMLVGTAGPSVLVENLFFDTRDEAEYLLSLEGQNAIADCMLMAILQIENEKPI